MNSHFLNGFAAELTKEAGAHPLFTSVRKTGTLLGKKVRGMVSRSMSKGKVKKHRMKKTAGTFNNYKKEGTFDMEKDYKQSGKGTGPVQADAAQRELKNKQGLGDGRGPKRGYLKAKASPRSKAMGNINSSLRSTQGKLQDIQGGMKSRSARGLPDLPKRPNMSGPKPMKMPGMPRPKMQRMDTDPEKMRPKYGPGKGLDSFKGQRAQPFTANDDKGKIGNPTENPENFKKKAAGPKTLARAVAQVRSGGLSGERMSRSRHKLRNLHIDSRNRNRARGGSGTENALSLDRVRATDQGADLSKELRDYLLSQ